MDILAHHFCGSQVQFDKGAVMAISLPQGFDGPGKMAWFVAGPDAQAWDAMAEVDAQVEQMAAELADACDAFLANPADPATLRAFRVNLRRLRSLVLFLSPWQSKKKGHRDADDLRALLDATSPLREIDILSDSVDALVEAGELGENCLLPVACAKERQLELEGVLSSCASATSSAACTTWPTRCRPSSGRAACSRPGFLPRTSRSTLTRNSLL